MSQDITKHQYTDNGHGRCYDCTMRPGGFWHVTELTLDEQFAALNSAYAEAEADAIGDNGDDAVESGGWAEIARAVCDLASPLVTAEAKDEWLRTQGLSSGYVKTLTITPHADVRAVILAAAGLPDLAPRPELRKSPLDAHPLFSGSPSQLAADRAWSRSAR